MVYSKVGQLPAISVKDASKKFRMFASTKERLWEAIHPFSKKYHREFWALKNINLEVPKGITVGIIGRNGSGKSTLLQVICSILRPTCGTVTVEGRISSILELGVGFNREFTGRENVFLQGTIMGFSRAKMKERLPLIEDFAEIGEFINQPVKTYSSGMFVRLAFAAAINVDPDVLIVDEALAVGDAKFQQKCYRKFIEFQKAGKTILFVTHDMNAIVKHSNHAILLEGGSIIESGKPGDVVNRYHEIILLGGPARDKNSLPTVPALSQGKTAGPNKPGQTELEKFIEEVPGTDNCVRRNSYNKSEYRFGDRRAEIVDYLVVSGENYDPTVVYSGAGVDIYLKAKFHQAVRAPMYGFLIKTTDGIPVSGSNTQLSSVLVQSARENDVVVFKFSVKFNLVAGDYFLDLGLDEILSNEVITLDKRCGLIHLCVQGMHRFDGFVELETTFQETSRKTIEPVTC